MTTMTIRHVPDDVRNELASRAARRGQSLQEYMVDQLTRLASRPSMDELMTQVRRRTERDAVHLDPGEILADRDADRA